MTKLRIISGSLKGRYVEVGEDAPFRPTQERVREAAAEIVKNRIRGAAAADICAGSGAFGFEMASRGAARVDFVETDGKTADRIAGNAARLGISDKIRVVRGDARSFINTAGRYDVIFYDPPYDSGELREAVPELLKLLTDGGLLIYERRRRKNEKKNADTGGKINIVDARIYSDTVIEIYKRNNNADSALPGDL